MLKNIAKLEKIIGERVYQFLCDNDSPTQDVKEALFQFVKFVGQVEDQAKAAQQPAEEPLVDPVPEAKKDEVKEVS